MRCKMCGIWENPTDPKKEFKAKDLEILPKLKAANITGGEPFLRDDLEEIIDVMTKKASRVLISTSGWHHEKIIRLSEKFPNVGFRISIEGLSQVNDDLRGRKGGFDRGLKLLLELANRGCKDIGFGITVSNYNSEDMLWLYKLSRKLSLEFATAAFHNSFYFHKYDNKINNKEEVIANFKKIITYLLKENNPKSWYRAFFNLGLIKYINGERRMLPCEAGLENFFIDPYGEVYPCNGMEEEIWKESMGSIYDFDRFEDLWFSEQAQKVREFVTRCPKNCWMIGSAGPVMKKYIKHPTMWVIKNKFKTLLGRDVCFDEEIFCNVGQDPNQGNNDFNFLKESKHEYNTYNCKHHSLQ